MFDFVLQKILSKKWMILSLIIGNILLIAIASASPIYSHAVLQDSLETNLSEYLVAENEYPGNITFTGEFDRNTDSSITDLTYMETMASSISDETGLTELNLIYDYYFKNIDIDLENGDNSSEKVNVGFLSDMEEHITIVSGEMYSSELEADGSIGVIISESMLITNNLLVGEAYTLDSLSDSDGNPYSVTIKGVFENSSDSDTYWINSPSSYTETAFMDMELFESLFRADILRYKLYSTITVQLDFTEIESSKVDKILDTSNSYANIAEDMETVEYSAIFSDIFTEHLEKESKLNVILLVFQVPIFILLAAFIYMVSKQILDLEQSEIAIFKSRGASKKQIIGIYLIQSSIISGISLIIGIPFGYLICQILGSSNAFLEFVSRSSIPATITPTAVLFALGASVFSIVTMVLPVFKHANVGIVSAKLKKQQKYKFTWWEKIGLDVILIGIAIYGWYSIEDQKELLIQKVAQGDSIDPFMFLYSSIFIIGVGLLSLRIFPWIIKLIFKIGKNGWSPSAYVSFRKIISSNDNQGFIMIFLTLTISLGIFNSITARTINSNEENNISYNTGTDVVVAELWADNSMEILADDTIEISYTEPDYGKYSDIDGVESYTKVYNNDDFTVTTNSTTLDNVTVMGITTDEFGRTAWFDEDLLTYHWYEYLNAISQNPEAILMSTNAKTDGGLEVGDSIVYYNETLDKKVKGTIYAFVDYWPSYNSVTSTISGDGSYSEISHYLIVANLSQVQSSLGVTPYEVWFNMEDSTQPIYDFATEQGISFITFNDATSDIIEQKNDPIFQGTNGILTVGFITILVLCLVGYLIYWILSMISRQLQFGVFRAMGMSMKEIFNMLIIEQACVSGYGILMGTITGLIASKLYVPLIEITYASSDQALPLELISYTSDYIRIFAIIGLMIAICMVVLFTMISKLKITQALKLGED